MSFIDNDKYLTANEMGQLIGVRPKTLYNWKHQGKLPAKTYYKFGNTLRFHKGKLIQFLNKGK